jgi:putative zinc finger/helix-turn-helix YgiT family protein
MERERVNHRYTESGLPNVVLVGVEMRRCPKCGEQALSIPRVEDLHKTLAMSLIHEHTRLASYEIRFLRKWLGLSGVDFARRMGVDPATVSRWESTEKPQSMGPVADRLLRMLVAHGQPIAEYPHILANLDDTLEHVDHLLAVRPVRTGWEPTSIAA